MTKTNWQDPGTSEIRSTHISGLQEAVGKLEDSIGLDTVHEINVPLTEVFISNDDRCRIYQAPEGKRNWLLSPTPVIKKNDTIITNDFEIDYGGGAIIFTNRISEKDTVTVDVTYTINKTVGIYSPPITTHDNVISLPNNATNGQVNLELKGETRTNLFESEYDFTTDEHEYSAVHGNVRLKPNTTYSQIIVPYRKGIQQYGGWTGVQQLFNYTESQVVVFNTPSDIKDTFTSAIKSINGIDDKNDFISTMNPKVMILEGDYTGRPVNFIEGTKSAIGSTRVKSVGKNLCKGNIYKFNKKWCKIKIRPFVHYALRFNGQLNNATTARPILRFFNKNNEITSGITSSSLYTNIGTSYYYNNECRLIGADITTDTFKRMTTHIKDVDADEIWIALSHGDINRTSYFTDVQLEEGDTATEYESYKESIAYITAKDDDKIVNLRSLPNGVKDKINEGKSIKNIQEYILQSADLTSVITVSTNVERINTSTSFLANANKQGWSNCQITGKLVIDGWVEKKYADSLENIGSFYTNVDGSITFIFAKGTTLEQAREQLAGTKLTYQLAEPEIVPLRWTGLNVEKNGTLYFDTIIPEIGFYYDNGLYSHTVNHPIEKVDILYKIDKQTGIHTPLDTSKCEFREDRLSFTHPDLQNGDLCDWDYVPEGQYPNTEKTIIVPTNLKASVDSLLKDSQIQKENIRQNNSMIENAKENTKGTVSSKFNIENGTTLYDKQINVSIDSTVKGFNSQVNASCYSTASKGFNQVNASNRSMASRCGSQVNASDRVINNTEYTVAGGYSSSGDPLTQNKKWELSSKYGTIKASGTITGNGSFADFAEYFESIDGKSIPLGTIVSLAEGGKIKVAQEGDFMIGATSQTAGVILNAQGFEWKNRYLYDRYGQPILVDKEIEEVVDIDGEGNKIKEKQIIKAPMLNENWDETQEYIPREDREEWNVVGLTGQIYTNVDDTVSEGDFVKVGKNGIATKGKNEFGQNWQVMKITTPYEEDLGHGIAIVFVR